MVDKVYEIIDMIEISDIKKTLEDVIKEIKSNSDIKRNIKEFKRATENYEKYGLTKGFIEAKKRLLENEIIKRYIDIQNEINLLTIKINKRINSITSDITCEK